MSKILRKGAISEKEKQFISRNKGVMSDVQMGEELNRSEEFVRKYRVMLAKKLGGNAPKITNIQDARLDVREKLKNSHIWQTLKKELSEEELKMFIEKYVDFIAQFQGNILPTEESQLHQAIKFEVLMSRELQSRKAVEDKIKSLELELSNMPPPNLRDKVDVDRASAIEDMLQSYRASSQNSYNSVYKFEELKEKLLTSLKATRDKRINKIDKVDISWLDVVKSLELEETRDIIGMQLNMGKKSYEKEYNRLGSSHKFTNETIDLPLLNVETYSGQETNGNSEVEETSDN